MYNKRLVNFILFFAASFFLFAQPVSALTVTSGDRVAISDGQPIAGTLIVAGKDVRIDNPVGGDIICAGQNVEINSQVGGDIICAAQNLRINGNVEGNIRAAGQNMVFNGNVGKNVMIAGEEINYSSTASGEMLYAAKHILFQGAIAGDVYGASEKSNVQGQIGRNLKLHSGTLIIGKESKIGGDLTYVSKNSAEISAGSKINGRINHSLPKEEKKSGRYFQQPRTNHFSSTNYILGRIGSLIVNLAIALLIVVLWPKHLVRVNETMIKYTKKSFGIGAMILFFSPLVILAMALTIIGIPLAVLTALAYGLAIVVGRILVATLIGRQLIVQYWSGMKNNLLVSSVVGVLISWIVFSIPAIGWLLTFLAVLWGLGGVYYWLRPIKATKEK